MTYKIEVDVLEAVQDFYPGLSLEDATQIAESIVSGIIPRCLIILLTTSHGMLIPMILT